ncbi:MAG: hypothetical protein EXR81_07040 [Gammaproteobacteria bacterium]|nr:hypothetical protein [Gammaproteobacteria bacterium]
MKDGIISATYQLQETKTDNYQERTELNVRRHWDLLVSKMKNLPPNLNKKLCLPISPNTPLVIVI